MMDGHAGFGPGKPRVAFQTVSAKRMDEFKFAVGDDISAKIGHELNLQVVEGFEPFGLTRDKKTGELGPQAPKMNPTTGQILTKGGRPIYRTTVPVLGEAKDTLIQHDVVAAPVAKPAAMQPNPLAN